MSDQQLDCALDLMRRLPPQQIEKNLSDLIDLVPSLCEDLLSSVDQPLKIARDKVVGKDYLLCDYNRDGDSYRSPWSNRYDPPLEDGAMPSARLRKLEVEANNAFDQYRDLYFEGGVSSVYLWDLDHGFAGVILIKKAGDGSKKIKGCWDSIHVVEVQEKSSGRTAHYKLTSTVMLWLQTNKSGSGTMNLGGSLTRQMEKDETVCDSSPHIANIGRLVEEAEVGPQCCSPDSSPVPRRRYFRGKGGGGGSGKSALPFCSSIQPESRRFSVNFYGMQKGFFFCFILFFFVKLKLKKKN
ncbi:F-actin-capping protein subunit beta isoform X1 [Petaurus breviceps papuanus]|uniref:F-actin-capping protein subunit beta isoform X1 n=1 Tax=Petaurus breviceps papuanus TaxID=3040969 RepID=UPI0036DF863F